MNTSTWQKAVTTVFLTFFVEETFATNPFTLTGAAGTAAEIAIFTSSVSDFSNEIGVSAETISEMNRLRRDVHDIQDNLYQAQSATNEAYGLTQPRFNRPDNAIYKLDSLTRYIRSLKHLGGLVLSLSGHPEAATALSLQQTNSLLFGILQNQERDHLAQERRGISEDQKELLRMMALKSMVDGEIKSIQNNTQHTGSHRSEPRDPGFGRAR
jgi:hypothetical protein